MESPAVITVETSIDAPIELVWIYWTDPDHIVNWNFASEEWHCPSAVNDLRSGGQLNWRMESKDGKMGFDLKGTYEEVDEPARLMYRLEDGRRVVVQFVIRDERVLVTWKFETEEKHSSEQQRAGWQAILDNFKRYVEAQIHTLEE
jgi:uncharacterized protein YndB with AHSA1/START domain